MRILVVEEDRSEAMAFRAALADGGFSVDVCRTGHEALQVAGTVPYSLILMDWNLPGLDGPSICRELHHRGSDALIAVLSARSDVRDKVLALESGADDFLVKPVDPRELVARARALGRRAGRRPVNPETRGGLRMDEQNLAVVIGEAMIALTQREYRLLGYMIRRAGETVPRADILAHVWARADGLASNVVDVYMRRLRAKFGDAGDCLKTVRGVGYRLEVAGGCGGDD